MVSETTKTRRDVEEFLSDIENAGLLKFPNPEWLQIAEEFGHRIEINRLKQSAINKIVQHQEQSKGTFIPENEWIAFNKKLHLSHMQENSEELKTYLKAIIDPQKIDPEINQLGTYLTKIYKKLIYTTEKSENMNKVFFKDFRNALSHLDYDISLDSIAWRKKDGESTVWKNNYLLIVMAQMVDTTDVINNKIEKIRSHE